MSRICYLTTIDNPFNPSIDDQFNDWLMYDNQNKWNCNELLARYCFPSLSLTDHENDEEIERAIDEIVENDPTNMYCKLVVEL